MNETTLVKGISAIGSMDGPTSVFLAGKLSVGVFAAVIAIGILIGFFGLKLVKVVAAFLGFLIGAGVGAGICALAWNWQWHLCLRFLLQYLQSR